MWTTSLVATHVSCMHNMLFVKLITHLEGQFDHCIASQKKKLYIIGFFLSCYSNFFPKTSPNNLFCNVHVPNYEKNTLVCTTNFEKPCVYIHFNPSYQPISKHELLRNTSSSSHYQCVQYNFHLKKKQKEIQNSSPWHFSNAYNVLFLNYEPKFSTAHTFYSISIFEFLNKPMISSTSISNFEREVVDSNSLKNNPQVGMNK